MATKRDSDTSGTATCSSVVIPCDICMAKDRKIEAQGYCQDCSAYVCSRCFNKHGHLGITKTHVLVSKESMPSRKRTLNSIQSKPGNNTKRNRGNSSNLVQKASNSRKFVEKGKQRRDHVSNLHQHDPVISKERLETDAESAHSHQVKLAVPLSANCVRDINVRSKNDENMCFITSSVLLSDDLLLLADFHNDTLKLVSLRSDQILSTLHVGTENEESALKSFNGPWDITLVGPSEVATTLPNQKKIKLLSQEAGAMYVDREIRVSGNCRGIVYKDEIFIVTYTTPSKVEVLSMQGEVLRSVSLDTLGFHCPLYVRLARDGQNVYVSDWLSRWVAIVTSEGSVEAKYTGEWANTFNGMYVPPDGHVFICEKRSNSVQVLTRDLGTKVASLSAEGLTEPMSLSCCEQTKQLFVGALGDTLKVMRLL